MYYSQFFDSHIYQSNQKLYLLMLFSGPELQTNNELFLLLTLTKIYKHCYKCVAHCYS